MLLTLYMGYRTKEAGDCRNQTSNSKKAGRFAYCSQCYAQGNVTLGIQDSNQY